MQLPGDLVSLPTQPWETRPTELPLDVEECRTALWLSRGNISAAAERLKITSLRLRKFIKSSPRLSAEQQEAVEQLADIAEDVVYEALTDLQDAGRRDTMARYVLSSQGKQRGWGTSSGGVKINNSAGGTVVIGWENGESFDDKPDEKVIEHE